MAETIDFVKMLDNSSFDISDPDSKKNGKGFNMTRTNIIRVIVLVAVVAIISFSISYLTAVVMLQDGKYKCSRMDRTTNVSRLIDSSKAIKGEDKDGTKYLGLGGQKGEKGDQGDPGPRGPQGTVGEKGLSGQNGLVGIMGEKGQSGVKGEKGVRGDPGPPGEQGPVGKTGLPGKNGMMGPNGDKGLNGEKGEKGSSGTKGEMGDNGPIGNTGLTGIKGERGEKGEEGDKGTTGDTGLPGNKGQKGETGLPGPSGSKGLRGDKGLTGDKGMVGDKGSMGEKGFPGAKGFNGDKGVRGEKGQPGERGPSGKSGTAVCPTGWVSFKNSCYLFVLNTKKTWNDAKTDCVRRNGSLIKVDDVVENWFIKSILKEMGGDSTWMGLHDTSREGHFIWDSDGSAAMFKDWAKSQPDNWRDIEDCAHFIKGDYQWNDISCANKLCYICETSSYS